MPRLALKFAYDGRKFTGFQRQPNVRTVEGDIRRTLVELDAAIANKRSTEDPTTPGISYTNRQDNEVNPFNYSYASRTDKGVSAMGNVLVLDSPKHPKEIISYLNSRLSNIHFHSYALVDRTFNPRYAKERWYRYVIPTFKMERSALGILINGKLCTIDLDEIRTILKMFEGTHDFSRFSKLEPGKNPIRTIRSTSVQVEERILGLPPILTIDIKGESFLWMMVRHMIGYLFESITSGSRSEYLEHIWSLTDPKPFLVPPTPLILKDVVFPDVNFHFTVPHSRILQELSGEAYLISEFSKTLFGF